MNSQRRRKIIFSVARVARDISEPSINALTPEDVAREVINCTRAGASMVHSHDVQTLAIVAHVSVGFANDFLDVPMGITAEWIGRIVHAMS